MGIFYAELNKEIRIHMLDEIQADVNANRLYISNRLNELGRRQWPELLRQAIENHNDDWLATQLRQRNYMADFEQKKKPTGGYTTSRIPITAANTLSEGEFNRFYIRGLCLSVIASGQNELEIYRGKPANNPRPESEQRIGTFLPAEKLLQDLRNSVGIDTALGLPPGPNSGLTVKRIQAS